MLSLILLLFVCLRGLYPEASPCFWSETLSCSKRPRTAVTCPISTLLQQWLLVHIVLHESNMVYQCQTEEAQTWFRGIFKHVALNETGKYVYKSTNVLVMQAVYTDLTLMARLGRRISSLLHKTVCITSRTLARTLCKYDLPRGPTEHLCAIETV